ncbi:Nif3-like dinuclear metal center hexameric protein [Candidatus Soleaferrea massiliensis]|uniref:Nif3-like dinuclear metal center hexameric protein n=1 Tax=Candidatus Soleaferrea massiliensis TaxID=1470354 RepID=UPI000693929F|nr:Nif3-like dinuclear metal center hexameric protein [Candidatus Soleaferrea massiliensis]
MQKPALSARLQLAASFVRQGSVVADIGTDHGYLAAYLVADGRCPSGYASDIHEQPLEKARETIRACGLEDRIQTVLSDGLLSLPKGCAQDIVIAGMGGDMIAKIIEEAPWLRDEHIRLVLQPMTKMDELRRYLYQNGFGLLREEAVEDGEFVYTVMQAVHTGQGKDVSMLFALSGLLPAYDTPAAKRYLLRQADIQQRKADGLRLSRRADPNQAAYHETLARRLRNLAKGEEQMNQHTVGDIYRTIDTKIAPFSLAESWDNPGLLIGGEELPVKKVLLAMDATDAVAEEAVSKRAELIVTHHPVIFSPIKRVEADSVVYKLIRNGISVISAHTNLDIAAGGVNDALAETLGLEQIEGFAQSGADTYYKLVAFVPSDHAAAVYRALRGAGAGTLGGYEGCAFSAEGTGCFEPRDGSNPFIGTAGKTQRVPETRLEMIVPPEKRAAVIAALHASHPYEVPAYDLFENHAVRGFRYMGRIGNLPEEMQPDDFAAYVGLKLGGVGVRCSPFGLPVRRVAVLGGSGADFLSQAKRAGADALVTADPKHHLFLEAAHIGVMLVDAGHFCTENVVMGRLCRSLREAFPQIEFEIAEQNTNPVRYR